LFRTRECTARISQYCSLIIVRASSRLNDILRQSFRVAKTQPRQIRTLCVEVLDQQDGLVSVRIKDAFSRSFGVVGKRNIDNGVALTAIRANTEIAGFGYYDLTAIAAESEFAEVDLTAVEVERTDIAVSNAVGCIDVDDGIVFSRQRRPGELFTFRVEVVCSVRKPELASEDRAVSSLSAIERKDTVRRAKVNINDAVATVSIGERRRGGAIDGNLTVGSCKCDHTGAEASGTTQREFCIRVFAAISKRDKPAVIAADIVSDCEAAYHKIQSTRPIERAAVDGTAARAFDCERRIKRHVGVGSSQIAHSVRARVHKLGV
jgi:hypothetical protein